MKHSAGRGDWVLPPKPLTSGSKARGRFGKQDFVYVAEKNEYRCPAGQSLIYRCTNLEAGLTTHAYWKYAACFWQKRGQKAELPDPAFRCTDTK